MAARERLGLCTWFFTVSAHISLVKKSLVAPPESKGSGKCEEADGTFGEQSHARDDFSRHPCFLTVQDRVHLKDQAGLRRDEGPDSECLGKSEVQPESSNDNFFSTFNKYIVPT